MKNVFYNYSSSGHTCDHLEKLEVKMEQGKLIIKELERCTK
jgi:hypothetical protein